MPSVVLITGVSRFLGGRLGAQLAADPSIERVIGIDTVPPRTADLPRLGRTEFVRADIRNPLVAKVMTQARVTTVVHAALMASARSAGGRTPMQEMNVIGTMQLLAACQKSDTVNRVVVKSTTAVYGCGPSDPAVFTEEMHPVARSQYGYAKDAVEVEGYVRGFGRRRPDIELTVLRLANIIGPTVDSALTRYLGMPLVPTALGYDPRLQLLHESDAIEAARLATIGERPGVFNVAGAGVMPLSQIIRRAGRVRLAVPTPILGMTGTAVRNAGVADFTAEEARFLKFGRAVDTTAVRERFGFTPRFSTAEAVADFADGLRPLPRVVQASLSAAAQAVQDRGNARAAAALAGALAVDARAVELGSV